MAEGTELAEFVDQNGRPMTPVPFNPSQSMTTDLDVNDHKFSAIGGLHFSSGFATRMGYTKIVYIGLRTDNVDGSGTSPLDARDGSTAAKLDTILRNLTPFTHVILGPGVFKTMGNSFELAANVRWTPCSNLFIEGSGDLLTTLRLENVASAYHWLIGGNFNEAPNDVTIQNLILDSNEQNQTTPGWSIPIGLNGNRNTVRHCHFINYASRLDAAEVFLCGLGASPAADVSDCLIEDCTIGQPAPGVTWGVSNAGFTAFILSGYGGGTPRYIRNSFIRNCRINDIAIGAVGAPVYLHGFSTAFAENCALEDCKAKNLTGGGGSSVVFYNDTGSNKNVYIRRPVLTNVAQGFYWLNEVTAQDGIHVEDALISVGAGGQAMIFSGGGGGLHSNLVLTRNTIKAYGALDPLTLKGISLYGITGAEVYDNIIDVGTAVERLKTYNTVTLRRADKNRMSDGTAIAPTNEDTGQSIRSDYYNISGTPGAEAHAASSQSIPNSAYTKITLGTEDLDLGGNFASSAFTAPIPGWYNVNGYAVLTLPSATQVAKLAVYKNAAFIALLEKERASMSTQDMDLTGAATLYLAATDVIDLRVFQDSGGAISLYNGAGGEARMRVTYLHA